MFRNILFCPNRPVLEFFSILYEMELISLHETHQTGEFIVQINMANSPNGNGRFVMTECARNAKILSQKHNADNSSQT